jgi:hypothetical protein
MSKRYRVRILSISVPPVDGEGWFLSGHFDGTVNEPKAAPASGAYCYDHATDAAQAAADADLTHFTVEPFELSSVPVPLLGGRNEKRSLENHRRLL